MESLWALTKSQLEELKLSVTWLARLDPTLFNIADSEVTEVTAYNEKATFWKAWTHGHGNLFCLCQFRSPECLSHPTYPTLAKTRTRVDCVWIREAFPDCLGNVGGLWRVAMWSPCLSQQLRGHVNCVVRVSKQLVSCRWVKSPEKPAAGSVLSIQVCRIVDLDLDWSMFMHHTLIQVSQKCTLLILDWMWVWYGYLPWAEYLSKYQSLPESELEIRRSLNHLNLKICNNIFHTTILCLWYTIIYAQYITR